MQLSGVSGRYNIGFADESREDAHSRALPPDITSVEYRSAACAGAGVWLGFLFYAASCGLG
jgi:hypothetical protein